MRDDFLNAALDNLAEHTPRGAALTAAEIARACGVRDNVIIRIEKRALEKMKKRLQQYVERGK